MKNKTVKNLAILLILVGCFFSCSKDVQNKTKAKKDKLTEISNLEMTDWILEGIILMDAIHCTPKM